MSHPRPVHLYWAFDQPRLIRDYPSVTMGFAVCGTRVEKEHLTKFVDDCNCQTCLVVLQARHVADNPRDKEEGPP